MRCSAPVSRKRKWVRPVSLVFLILVSAAAIVAVLFPQKLLCVDSGPVQADVIVVLGGAHERPERAAELFKAHDAGRIIVSGLGDTEINRRLLIEGGVPANVIQLEPKSHTTKENAQF